MFRASSCPSSGATTSAVAASGLPSELGDNSAVGRCRAGRPDHDQHHCYHLAPTVNQRLLLHLLYLLMMGMRMPETCWTVFKWQVIHLRICFIWLVDSVESMMMHEIANPKSWKVTECTQPLFYALVTFLIKLAYIKNYIPIRIKWLA